MTVHRFETLLVANRGEIARRILRSAREMGLRTVAVYSEADRQSLHVGEADQALCIGPGPAVESYLDVDRVMAAARASGAEAIHPGYGFLAERPELVEACEAAGLTFVGPSAEVMRAMGSKLAAKAVAKRLGVPLLPSRGEEEGAVDLLEAARELGPPLMIKADAGGGGKGMRLVESLEGLEELLAAARREAQAAFGSDRLYLERALRAPRHVEVQIIADEGGQVVALGDRDCSIQRRHQKLIEEAPAPGLSPDLRAALADAACRIARAIGYVSAGTVEFLVEGDAFFFLEMNTRLQVEHPVTEAIYDVDLVALQLRVAQGLPLPADLAARRPRGHAIEARLCAEDPARGFLPASGRIRRYRPPSGVRVDSGAGEGIEVTPLYDSLLAKVIAWGEDRETARRRLRRALETFLLQGLVTNRRFLLDMVDSAAFVGAAVTTRSIDDRPPASPPPPAMCAAAAACLYEHRRRRAPWRDRARGLAGWTNAPWLYAPLRLDMAGEERAFSVSARGDEIEVRLEDETWLVTMEEDHLRLEGERLWWALTEGEEMVEVALGAWDLTIVDRTFPGGRSGPEGAAGVLVAPMHGRVTEVCVGEGQEVDEGDRLLVLEAMKMEHPIVAGRSGRVVYVAAAGAQVAAGDVLARLAQAEEE